MVYFCHGCDREVPHAMEQPNGELLCSVCLEPFVEILNRQEAMEIETESAEPVQQPHHNNPPPPQQQQNVGVSFHFQVNHGANGRSSFRSSSMFVNIPPPERLGPFAFGMPPQGMMPPFLDMSDNNGADIFETFFGGVPDESGGSARFGDFVVGDMSELLARMHRQHEDEGKPPATEEAINQLNTRVLTKEDVSTLGDHQCAVCQDNYLENEEVACLPCGHTYHKDCVVPWLTRHCTCPVCRAEVKTVNQPMNPSPSEVPNV